MAAWRFFQGVRAEWRWYRLAGSGSVLGESSRAFDSLGACMADAARAGFDGHTYAVHTHRDWRRRPTEARTADLDEAEAPVEDALPANGAPPADGSHDTRGSAST